MRNLKLKRVLASAGAITAATIALVACGSGSSFSAPDAPDETTVQQNTDPRQGWVMLWPDSSSDQIYYSTYKRCDGSTLVYATDDLRAGLGGVVPNSPECGSPTS